MICRVFTDGALLTSTNTVKRATLLIEHDGLTAVILDHALSDGDCDGLCARLMKRGVPFLMHTGYPAINGPCKGAPHLRKPSTHEEILDAVEALIRDKISN